jgi:hypothetical protein
MTVLESIKDQISRLPDQERRELANWLERHEEHAWDQQIASDHKAGKLEGLMARAKQEAVEGRLRELP